MKRREVCSKGGAMTTRVWGQNEGNPQIFLFYVWAPVLTCVLGYRGGCFPGVRADHMRALRHTRQSPSSPSLGGIAEGAQVLPAYEE